MEEMTKRKRKSIRVPGYDYTNPGDYFVTIVTYQRLPIFGEVLKEEVLLNDLGKIAQAEWFKTARLREYVEVYEGEFVVMPNHIHGIIHIVDQTPVGAQRRCAPTNEPHKINVSPHSLGAIIRGYKSAVTYAIHLTKNSRGTPVWQCNYYEHIIGSEKEYQKIEEYILNNPSNWFTDEENNLPSN